MHRPSSALAQRWIQSRYALGAVIRTFYHPLRTATGGRDTISATRLRQRWALMPRQVQALAHQRPVWIVLNGGEVTQTVTFLKLLHQAVQPVPIVLATSNQYAMDFAARHLPWLAQTIEVPWDLAVTCRRALEQARPRAVVFVENVYAPVLARTAHEMGIPTILASGLVQLRFREHPLYTKAFQFGFFNDIDLHIVKDTRDARTLTDELGVPADRVRIAGNLKFDVEFLSRKEKVTSLTRKALGPEWESAFVLVAGSIHTPEERLIGDAVRLLRDRGHHVRLIVAPRYPAGAPVVASALASAGISSRLRSALQPGAEAVAADALIVDTFGELPVLYGFADAVIMGGTFFRRWKVGFGQNIVEPLMAARAIVHGPYIGQFEDIRDRLRTVWPGTEVDTAQGLAGSIGALIEQPVLRKRLADEARSIVEANAGSAVRHVDWILEMLKQRQDAYSP